MQRRTLIESSDEAFDLEFHSLKGNKNKLSDVCFNMVSDNVDRDDLLYLRANFFFKFKFKDSHLPRLNTNSNIHQVAPDGWCGYRVLFRIYRAGKYMNIPIYMYVFNFSNFNIL